MAFIKTVDKYYNLFSGLHAKIKLIEHIFSYFFIISFSTYPVLPISS